MGRERLPVRVLGKRETGESERSGMKRIGEEVVEDRVAVEVVGDWQQRK